MALCDEPTLSIIEPETVLDVIRESGKQTAVPEVEDKFVKKRFQFFEVGELTKDIRPTDWLIEDFIEADTLALCFAPPASFKSFFAVDIAASIATGTAWHGNEVKPGAVFYIAGEGREGLKKRFGLGKLPEAQKLKGIPCT